MKYKRLDIKFLGLTDVSSVHSTQRYSFRIKNSSWIRSTHAPAVHVCLGQTYKMFPNKKSLKPKGTVRARCLPSPHTKFSWQVQISDDNYQIRYYENTIKSGRKPFDETLCHTPGMMLSGQLCFGFHLAARLVINNPKYLYLPIISNLWCSRGSLLVY